MLRKQFMTLLQDVYVFVSHDVCINFVVNAYYAVLRQFNFFFRVIIWSLSISASCKAQYLKGNCSHLKLQNWVTKMLMSHAFFVEFMRKGIYLKLFNLSGLNAQRVLILLYKVFVHWKLKLLNLLVDFVSLPWSESDIKHRLLIRQKKRCKQRFLYLTIIRRRQS